MNIQKVFNNKENVNKLINYIQSFDNKFISLELKDENTFSFYFIPHASGWKETTIKDMIEAVKSGHVLAFGSSIREATVKVNVNTSGAKVTYTYPNHFGTQGMEDMAEKFDNFLYKEIDAKYKEEVIKKFIESKFEKEEEQGM